MCFKHSIQAILLGGRNRNKDEGPVLHRDTADDEAERERDVIYLTLTIDVPNGT